MVQFVGAADQPLRFSVTARPNPVAGRPGLRISMGILVPCCAVAGSYFYSVGAWPITLFMGLNVVALWAAFQYVERHADDFERLTLADDRLILDTHNPDGDQHLEFNGFWVQIDLRARSIGSGSTLWLRSQGREVAFGRLMSDSECRAVKRELGCRLARLRR
jgi:uncharacterized membrane protein